MFVHFLEGACTFMFPCRSNSHLMLEAMKLTLCCSEQLGKHRHITILNVARRFVPTRSDFLNNARKKATPVFIKYHEIYEKKQKSAPPTATQSQEARETDPTSSGNCHPANRAKEGAWAMAQRAGFTPSGGPVLRAAQAGSATPKTPRDWVLRCFGACVVFFFLQASVFAWLSCVLRSSPQEIVPNKVRFDFQVDRLLYYLERALWNVTIRSSLARLHCS